MHEDSRTMDGYAPAMFVCVECGEEFEDHLPALETCFDAWPECCETRSWLIAPLGEPG
jgi:hypothetical protein